MNHINYLPAKSSVPLDFKQFSVSKLTKTLSPISTAGHQESERLKPLQTHFNNPSSACLSASRRTSLQLL